MKRGAWKEKVKVRGRKDKRQDRAKQSRAEQSLGWPSEDVTRQSGASERHTSLAQGKAENVGHCMEWKAAEKETRTNDGQLQRVSVESKKRQERDETGRQRAESKSQENKRARERESEMEPQNGGRTIWEEKRRGKMAPSQRTGRRDVGQTSGTRNPDYGRASRRQGVREIRAIRAVGAVRAARAGQGITDGEPGKSYPIIA